MNSWPNNKQIERVKERYKPGMRVKLMQMDDASASPVGTRGTVQFVDDIGSVHVVWDNGSTLAVVLGEDYCVEDYSDA